MNPDALVIAFLAQSEFETGAPTPIASAPWIDSFEDTVGLRFPGAFGRLVRSYAFPEFEAGSLWFYPNSGYSDGDLVRRIVADPVLAKVTRANGLLHFARPADGSYDPICFDMTQKSGPPIVRLDHEAALLNEKIVVVDKIAASFEAFMRRYVDT